MYVLDWNDEISDECLMDAVAKGNITAIETLYERYSRPFFSLAFQRTANRQIAEDLVQEAFIAIWRNSTTYSAETGNARNWLFSIMRYRIIDYLRRQRNHSSLCKELPWEDINYEETLSLPDPWEEIWCAEQANIIRKALQTLPQDQRRVIELAYFEGLTHEEIASTCHIPLGTAKSRLRLGLLRLKRALTRRGIVSP